ncbi:FAD-binding oxidoreductase [Paralimibaculum aggregatum]|uniref:FAD-binding oxidoreductase n=1 Tax=Paralimibaculum aggregatum TaxID=3036245 RepID=A0ABQ6LGS1_9RHOB|nr:FAD-binding oxidoreductase [Limibaculum sp. NKW23]GMG81279.1 FAD-binding oxidoreductase [Limibaculum sp. NKW23]
MKIRTPSPDAISHLHALIGEAGPPADGVAPRYLAEPRDRYHGRAATVLRPRDTGEVAAIVGYCQGAGIGVIPYSGGTGLVGGQLVEDGPLPVILSLERMDRIRSVSAEDNAMVVEAGAILADVQAAAAEANRLFPLSLAAEGSARIGGNLATNAGGVQVLRYGTARELCLGIEAVLPDGSVHHGLKLLRKDNTGYDLRHLLIGAEGTLGVITAAALKLFPRPAETLTAMIAVPDPAAAVALLGRLRDRLGDGISGFELIGRLGLRFLAEHFPERRDPLESDPEWRVLMEIGAPPETGLAARAEAALAEAFEAGLATDGVLASSQAQAQAMWAIRETIPEANRLVGAIASHDIAVPIGSIAEFIERGRAAIAAVDPALRINCFGHIGDGNLHYNLFPPEGATKADFVHRREAGTAALHELAVSLGGTYSAEHGIGRAKLADLQRFGDPAKLAAMRAIKQALDPAGVMNPGAVLPAAVPDAPAEAGGAAAG